VSLTDKDHFIEFGKHSGIVNTKFKTYKLKTCECVSKITFYSEDRDSDFERLSGEQWKERSLKVWRYNIELF
jgi:hypothetical protein